MAIQDLALPLTAGGDVHPHLTDTSWLQLPPYRGAALRRLRPSHAPANSTQLWNTTTPTTLFTTPLHALVNLVHMSPGLRPFHRAAWYVLT